MTRMRALWQWVRAHSIHVLITYPATVRLSVATVWVWGLAAVAPAGVFGWGLVGACVVVVAGATWVVCAVKVHTVARTLLTVLILSAAAGGVVVAHTHARSPADRVSGVVTVVTDPAHVGSGLYRAQVAQFPRTLSVVSHTALPSAGTRLAIDVTASRDGPQSSAYLHDWTVVSAPGVAWRIRASLREHLRDSSGTHHAGARLLPGLVVGDTSLIDAQTESHLTAMSLTHVTAVSGANISIVSLAVLGLMRAVTVNRGLGVGCAVALTAVYVFIVGPEPSVIRAAGMGLIGAIVLVRGTGKAALAVISAAVLGLLVVRPELAVSAGFILSVAATTSLMVLGQPVTGALVRIGVPRFFATLLAVPFTAQVGVLPVMVALGSAPSAWAVAANAAVAPVIAPATLVGMLVLLSQPFGFMGPALAWVGGIFAWWIPAVASLAVTLPGARAQWVPGVWGIGLAVAITLAVAIAILTRYTRLGALVGVLLFVVATCVPLFGTRVVGNWVLAVCDVGQGSATVLKTAPGAALVVDTGADDTRIDTCLAQLRVRRLDLVLSHLDRDHAGAVSGALRGRALGQVFVSGQDAGSDELAALHLPHYTPVAAGDSFVHGSLQWNVLWPRHPSEGAVHAGGNATSVVVYARVSDITVLIPGDVGEDQQRVLTRNAPHADVLIAPHHGSKDIDPRFFAAVGARVGVVSVGSNTYGHPTQTALRAFGPIPVLRTDMCATLVLTAGGGFGSLSGQPGCSTRL